MISLRQYQLDAIDAWISNEYLGIWQMATGTGKTLTALSAATEVLKFCRTRSKSLLVVVVCPYLNLVDQWTKAFKHAGWNSVSAYESSVNWLPKIAELANKLAIFPGSRGLVVTTLATFSSGTFAKSLSSFSAEMLIIGDECHNFGTERAAENLPLRAKYRLGLSATPKRHNDAEGTRIIERYFGGVTFKYELGDAIRDGWLSPYNYMPRVCPMDFEEQNFYEDISTKIVTALGGRDLGDLSPEEQKYVGTLIRLRNALLGTIESKWTPFQTDLELERLTSAQLIYCAEGASPIGRQVRQIERAKSCLDLMHFGSSAIYDANVNRRRRNEILGDFGKGEIKYILSMRCLDEGVDLPNANTGYLLASSNNPRQFIQRRGRLLRLNKGKEFATIYDYLVLPKMSAGGHTIDLNGVLKRELARAQDFSKSAMNSEYAVSVLNKLGGN